MRHIKFTTPYTLTLFILQVVVLHLLLSEGLAQSVPDHYEARNGFMDLQEWTHGGEEIIKLQGQWHFYPNSLSDEIENLKPATITVPLSWEENETFPLSAHGFAAYRLQLSNLRPDHLYGFKILDQVSSFRLLINGKEAASNGQVGRNRDEYTPDWKPAFGTFMTDNAGNATFVVEIANFDYNRGGFWNAIQIGTPEAINQSKLHQVCLDIFLFSSILAMGLFFLGMYFVRPKDKGMLYFSLFCLCISFRVILTGERLLVEYLPFLPWEFRVRMEYFCGYLLLPLFSLFFSKLFPIESSKVFQRISLLSLLLFGSTPLILAHSTYSSLLIYYKMLTLVVCLYFLGILARVVRRRKTGGILTLIAFCTLLAAIIKETFFPNEFNVLPYAALIFIISFSLINMKKYFWILQENQVLESKAKTDALTGLLNRDYFMNYLDNLFYTCNSPPAGSLLFLDLDSFKEVNDTYGHEAGDAILKEVGGRLKSLCRKSDLICRYGGDEFLIFLNEDGLDHAESIAERVINAIQEPVHFRDSLLQIGVSIGISNYSEDAATAEHLIKHSDHAMYVSKKDGGNRFTIFSKEIEYAIC